MLLLDLSAVGKLDIQQLSGAAVGAAIFISGGICNQAGVAACVVVFERGFFAESIANGPDFPPIGKICGRQDVDLAPRLGVAADGRQVSP